MEHCSALRLSLCILLVLNMTQPVARAAADTLDPAVYARAEALLGPNLVDQARNSFFTPHWLGDGELFWYRKELPNGHEDVVIDAATGKPTTRFDAAELARQVQAVYASETAPTDVLMAPDGGSGVASRGGNLWLVPAADTGAARALTTDGTLIAGYGIWPDNWQANLIPRERAQRLTPPVET